MTPAAFARLKKLLTLATSDNDAEALASWRAATALVAREGATWDMMMDRRVPVVNEVEAAPINPIVTALEKALAANPRDPTLQSIAEQWCKQEYLTPNQHAYVMRKA